MELKRGNLDREATVIMYHYVRPIEGSEYEGIKGLELKKFIEDRLFIKELQNH